MKRPRGRSCAGWLICAGVALAGLGVLAWAASFGGFTALGYGWYLLVRKLSASRARFEERLSYLEYVQRRREKRKSPGCVLGTGLICIAAAGIFLYLYRQ